MFDAGGAGFPSDAVVAGVGLAVVGFTFEDGIRNDVWEFGIRVTDVALFRLEVFASHALFWNA